MRAVITVLGGAAVFWIPDVLAHAGSREGFGAAEVLLITMVMPVLSLVAYARVDRKGKHTLRGSPRALLMVVGIWVFGPTFMMMNATFGGAGFLSLSTWTEWSMLFHVPAVTFIFATYDGALGALLFVTLLLPCAAVLGSRAERARHSAEDGPHNDELQRAKPAQAAELRR